MSPFDGEVAGDEGPGHPELARGPQDAAQGVDRPDPQRPDPVGGTEPAPVPELEPHRCGAAHQGPDQGGQGLGGAARRGPADPSPPGPVPPAGTDGTRPGPGVVPVPVAGSTPQ